MRKKDCSKPDRKYALIVGTFGYNPIVDRRLDVRCGDGYELGRLNLTSVKLTNMTDWCPPVHVLIIGLTSDATFVALPLTSGPEQE